MIIFMNAYFNTKKFMLEDPKLPAFGKLWPTVNNYGWSKLAMAGEPGADLEYQKLD